MIYAISGIRDIHPSDECIVELEIAELLSSDVDNQIEALVFGGARGVDTTALAAACIARGCNSTPKLIVIVPSHVQDQPYAAQEYIQECADEIVELHLPVGRASSYQQRNIAMLERADALLAFWDGSSGGTNNAITAARRLGIPVSVVTVRRKI